MHAVIWQTCLPDVEEAMDDFLMEFGTFPLMEASEEGACRYCGAPAAYRLVLPDGRKHPEINESKEIG